VNTGEAPDYIQPVAGVRIWRVAPNLLSQHMGLLWGPGVREPWPTGKEMVASCDDEYCEHEPPRDDCGCGLYAFYDVTGAIAGDYWPKAHRPFFDRLVAGVLAGTGDVVLHEWGFRAERGRVAAIFGAAELGGNIHGAPDKELPLPREIIADAYGAELIAVPDYQDFCERQGFVTFAPGYLD
jgi:hypothetical protein